MANFEKPSLRKGEQKFLEKVETLHKERPGFPEKSKEEKVKITLEEIKREIEELPEVKSEISFHPQYSPSQMTNILAQAIQIAINESIEEGFKFIYKTNNPYLIDAFHDLIIAHFINLIKQ